MRRIFIICLIIIEAISFALMLLISNFTLSSANSLREELLNNTLSYITFKFFGNAIIAAWGSVLTFVAYWIITRITKQSLPWNGPRLLLFQWGVLFIIWLASFIVQCIYLLNPS